MIWHRRLSELRRTGGFYCLPNLVHWGLQGKPKFKIFGKLRDNLLVLKTKRSVEQNRDKTRRDIGSLCLSFRHWSSDTSYTSVGHLTGTMSLLSWPGCLYEIRVTRYKDSFDWVMFVFVSCFPRGFLSRQSSWEKDLCVLRVWNMWCEWGLQSERGANKPLPL